MLLCYLPIKQGEEINLKLCLVPDKPDMLTLPIEIDKFSPTIPAIVRLSAEESCTVAVDPQDNQLIISSLAPSRIYLTPNLSQFPGMHTGHIKVVRYEDDSLRTFYSRDKVTWEEWVANYERK